MDFGYINMDSISLFCSLHFLFNIFVCFELHTFRLFNNVFIIITIFHYMSAWIAHVKEVQHQIVIVLTRFQDSVRSVVRQGKVGISSSRPPIVGEVGR